MIALPQYEQDNRIVGGSDDVIENVPFQISLHRTGSHHCGGSILNQNTILSAAHCVE
jgi:trypsin